jgi:hypothetical protein
MMTRNASRMNAAMAMSLKSLASPRSEQSRFAAQKKKARVNSVVFAHPTGAERLRAFGPVPQGRGNPDACSKRILGRRYWIARENGHFQQQPSGVPDEQGALDPRCPKPRRAPRPAKVAGHVPGSRPWDRAHRLEEIRSARKPPPRKKHYRKWFRREDGCGASSPRRASVWARRVSRLRRAPTRPHVGTSSIERAYLRESVCNARSTESADHCRVGLPGKVRKKGLDVGRDDAAVRDVNTRHPERLALGRRRVDLGEGDVASRPRESDASRLADRRNEQPMLH